MNFYFKKGNIRCKKKKSSYFAFLTSKLSSLFNQYVKVKNDKLHFIHYGVDKS